MRDRTVFMVLIQLLITLDKLKGSAKSGTLLLETQPPEIDYIDIIHIQSFQGSFKQTM